LLLSLDIAQIALGTFDKISITHTTESGFHLWGQIPQNKSYKNNQPIFQAIKMTDPQPEGSLAIQLLIRQSN